MAQAQTYDDLRQILREHPSVIAINGEVAAESELAKAERGWSDPVLSLGVNNVPINDPGFDRFLPSNKSIGVRQQIPNFGAQNARSRRRQTMSEAGRIRADYQIERLEAALIGALADRQKITRQTDFAERQLKLYKELEDILRGQLASGRSLYFRFAEIDVERTDIDRRLNDLNNEMRDVSARLEWLVGSVPDMPPPDVEVNVWDGSPNTLYPALIADKDVHAAREGVAEKAAAYRPDVGVGLQYHQREAGANGAFAGDDWFSVGVNVSIPLWAAGNQAPRLRAAKAQESSAKARFQNTVEEWRQRLTSLYSTHATATKNASLLRAKMTSLTELRSAAKRNYEAGRSGYEHVLDAEINKLTIASQLEEETARIVKTAADINSHLVTP